MSTFLISGALTATVLLASAANAAFETRPATGMQEVAPQGSESGTGEPWVLAQNVQGHGHSHEAGAMAMVGDLMVENPWARESVTRTAAAYLTVHNNGDQDDRLVGAGSDVAERVELHTSEMEDGVMKMRAVEAVDVPANGEAALAPGGLHIMLIGLHGPLVEGESFTMTLEFEHAGTVEVETSIEDIGHGGGHSHSHSH